jgi:tetratricopeptide (TPR) repeat protein
MRRIRTLAPLLLLAGLAHARPAASQGDSLVLRGKHLLREGMNTGSVERVLEARSHFERAAAERPLADLAEYHVALADFRLIALYGNARDDRRKALEHADAAIRALESLVRRRPDFAEAHALLGSAYGQKVGLRPVLGMTLGPRSGRALSRARELAPDNPRVVLLDAIGAYNTPRMFGGSRERAREGFARAIRLFAAEKATDPLQPDWGSDEAYAWLGIAHRAEGRTDQARSAFEAALRLNPQNGWVRHQLLPSLDAPADP